MPGILADINEHRSKRRKLSGSDLYHDVLGSPKLIVAPMVDQSELVCPDLYIIIIQSHVIIYLALANFVSTIWCTGECAGLIDRAKV